MGKPLLQRADGWLILCNVSRVKIFVYDIKDDPVPIGLDPYEGVEKRS
jgi:hypothetical protein